jgi:hypothetical protein
MRWWAPAACIAAWLAAAPAEAQPVDNSFAIDLFQGVVLAPIRVTSMGGAYAGYAEGIAGFVANAASPAVRHSHSSGWWNFEIDGSVSFPIVLFRNNDFDNSGDFDADYANFIYLSGGLQLQAGPFGAGFFGDLQRYTLTFPPDDAATYVTVGRYHLLVGWGFFGDQFDVGAGVRALSLGIDATDVAFSVFGASPQVGFLVKPDWTPFRVGATYRHLVRGGRTSESGITEVDGVERAGPLVLPDRVELPWELELGVSLQVGPRPINPRWIDPDEHEAELRDAFEARRKARREQIARRLRRLPAGKMRQQLGKQLWDEERIVAERERRRYARDLDRLIDERRAHARNWPREALLLTADLLITGHAVRRGRLGRARQLLAALRHRGRAAAGLDPHPLRQLLRAAALPLRGAALRARGHELRGSRRPPALHLRRRSEALQHHLVRPRPRGDLQAPGLRRPHRPLPVLRRRLRRLVLTSVPDLKKHIDAAL